jgi:hypothetical protein
MATEAMLNVSVPQTGKDVPGFCPSSVQGVCAETVRMKKRNRKRKQMNIFCSIVIGKVKQDGLPGNSAATVNDF